MKHATKISWIVLLICLIFFTNAAYCQLKNRVETQEKDSLQSDMNVILKLDPIKAISFYNAGIDIGIEKRFGKHLTTQISGAYLFPISPWNIYMDMDNADEVDSIENYNYDIRGFEIGIEQKYYLKPTAPLGIYFSLECNYLKNKFKDVWNFGEANVFSDSGIFVPNYPDSIRIHKQTLSFNFKIGYQYVLDRFIFDIYGGLGIRYKEVEHLDRINPAHEMESTRHTNARYYSNKNGKYSTLIIPLGVKVGWAF